MVSKHRKNVVITACAIACLAGVGGVGFGVATAPDVVADGPTNTQGLPDNMPEMLQMATDTLEPSPLERTALESAAETGRIADQDYEAAHIRYVDCMTKEGFEPSFRKSSDGFYVELPYESVNDSSALDAATRQCSADTRVVESLYRIQQANPELQDTNTMLQDVEPKLVTDSRTLAVQCLQRNGTVGAEYSAEEFEQDWIKDQFPFDADEVTNNDCLYGAGYAYFTVTQ